MAGKFTYPYLAFRAKLKASESTPGHSNRPWPSLWEGWKSGRSAPGGSQQGNDHQWTSRSPENQEAIRDAIAKICEGFDDAYWLKKDHEGGFPHDFHKALADAGWLGICVPEAYGGSGLGITEAAIMMRTIAKSGAGMSGASAVHINVFGLNPVVVFGTEEQRKRMLPPMVEGREKACFAVTEPNTGLNTTQLKTRAVAKNDRYIVNGQKVWISTAQVAHKILLLARTTPLEEVR